jgi:hypothetical protein
MSREPKIRDFESTWITSYMTLTPAKLKEIAYELEMNGIEHIEISAESSYGDPYLRCTESRMETPIEAAERHEAEVKKEERSKAYRQQEYLRLSKEFGGTS